MVKYCSKCGAENNDDAQFCKSCGFDLQSKENKTKSKNGILNTIFYKTDKNTGEQRISKGKSIIIALVLLFIIFIAFGSSSTNTVSPESTINVSDLKVSNQGYGLYDISGNLVPDKDYRYLEMVVVFYDDSGAVIEKSPLAWNMNDINKGQTIKVSGHGYATGDNVASKAEVYFFDSAFSGSDLSDAIYNETVII